MNYEQAADKYLTVKRDMEALDREYKERKGKIKEKMVVLENWFTAKGFRLSRLPLAQRTGQHTTRRQLRHEKTFLTFVEIKTLGTYSKLARQRPQSKVT